jgi:hypothetical protein
MAAYYDALWSQVGSIIVWDFIPSAILGAVAGIYTTIFIGRHAEPALYRWLEKWTVGYELDRPTDIRTVGKLMPRAVDYRPEKYYRDDAVFLAVDAKRKPLYVALDHLRESHCQLLGRTGCGKTSLAGLMLTQLARLGDGIVILDPKSDEHMSSVLATAADQAGVNFHYVDLCDPSPQLNLLSNITRRELEALLIAGFGLERTQSDADVWRLIDRAPRRCSRLPAWHPLEPRRVGRRYVTKPRHHR